MSLITPLFLLGLLGIGLPLWLHRLQTQTNEREQFASSMFLEQTRHRIHVQKKLKYLVLMALRILFFILLALAFTRPVWNLSQQALLGDDDTHHVIVVDTSLSMQQGNLFGQARDRAREIVNDMDSGDQASLFSASSVVTSISEPTPDTAALLGQINAMEADKGRLDIGAAMAALNTLVRESSANIQLHFISDFQQSGQPVRFADMIPDVTGDRPVSLVLERIGAVNSANWAITDVTVEQSEARVTVQGFNTPAADLSLQLSINGESQGVLEQSVSENGAQTYLFENLIFAEGDNRVDVQITDPDDLPGDNQRHTVFDNSPPAPVLLITSDPDSLSVTYIRAALATAPRPYEAEVQAVTELDPRILGRYAWIIVDDIGAVNDNLAELMNEYLQSGGGIFAAMGPRSEGISTVPVSGQTVSGSLNLTTGRRLITSIDTSHPALRDSDGWATVNITQALPLLAGAQDTVLMNMNEDIPLLMERRIGLGQFMLLNSALDNSWTDLPLKPVFVGFMAETARYLSGESVLQRDQTIHSYLQLASAGGSSGQVYAPDGSAMLSLEDTTSTREVLLDETGYYQVFTPSGEVLVAVNPDMRESDTTAMTVQALQNWESAAAGIPASERLAGESGNAFPEEPGSTLDLWRVLLMLLVVIVIAESLFGNRHLRFNTDTPLASSGTSPTGIPT